MTGTLLGGVAPGRAALGGVAFSFARGLSLQRPNPPAPPPTLKGFGSGCWKASCTVYTKDENTVARYGALEDAHGVLGCPVARTTGYGSGPQVAQETEAACRAHVAENLPKRGLTCGEAQLVMLPDSALDCSRDFFFEIGGTYTRIRAP